MQTVGTVAELWRYPVKSMQGERVEHLDITSSGAGGDRVLAVVDPAAGKVLSGKRWPQLLMASARSTSNGIVLTLPDGTDHEAGDPAVHGALSAWLDHEVRLDVPPSGRVFPMEMHTGMSDEDSPLFDWPGPEGRWVDVADVHWLTTASLRAAAGLHPDGQWDVRRFRPTALIEVEGDGWAEDGWSTVVAGGCTTDVFMRTPRCTLPPRAQPGLDRDVELGRALRDGHGNDLGVYAQVTEPGPVAVGDHVGATG